MVYNLPDLQAAIADRKRDIEIRSHLDLRNLPLKQNPKVGPDIDPFPSRTPINTDLAFLSWPTRSIRVRRHCHHACMRMHTSNVCIWDI